MSKNLRELQARKAKHVAAMRAITDKAAAEGRDLTDDEASAFDTERAALTGLSAAITREEALIEAERSVTIPAAAGATVTVSENVENDPSRGFRSFGEFAAAVRSAGVGIGAVDRRLTIGAAAPGVAANEGAGQDGGFLIPPQFSTDIFTLSLE